jgi:hypothetical protein
MKCGTVSQPVERGGGAQGLAEQVRTTRTDRDYSSR